MYDLQKEEEEHVLVAGEYTLCVYVQIYMYIHTNPSLYELNDPALMLPWRPISTSCKMTNNRILLFFESKMETKKQKKTIQKSRIFWIFEQSGNAVDAWKKKCRCVRGWKVGSRVERTKEEGKGEDISVYKYIESNTYGNILYLHDRMT